MLFFNSSLPVVFYSFLNEIATATRNEDASNNNLLDYKYNRRHPSHRNNNEKKNKEERRKKERQFNDLKQRTNKERKKRSRVPYLEVYQSKPL